MLVILGILIGAALVFARHAKRTELNERGLSALLEID
jgi:hypothetical protein